jgi:hypothetical protein
VISPDGHIEATRPHQRIPCSKGEEGYVGFSGLGVRVDQLLRQGGGGSPRLCKVEGESPAEVWR